MKSVTVRLEKKHEEMLKELMELLNEKTASKVLLRCLFAYKSTNRMLATAVDESIILQDEINERDIVIKHLRYLDDK